MKKSILFAGLMFLSVLYLASEAKFNAPKAYPNKQASANTISDGANVFINPKDSSDQSDDYGYTWVDNDNGGSPIYDWKDISSIGVPVEGLMDDNVVGLFNIGFDFPFYWYTVDRFYIGANGYISFSSDANYYQQFPMIPTSTQPNNLVVPLACDLDFTAPYGTNECYYYTNNIDSLIISWIGVNEWGCPYVDGHTHTFQLILCASDSSITFQYGEQSGNFQNPYGACQIGIEDLLGATGLLYMFNLQPSTRVPHDGLAIRIHADPNPDFVFHDVGVAYCMNETSSGIFCPLNNPLTLRGLVGNYGTMPEDDIVFNCKVKRGYSTLYNRNFDLDHLEPDEETWIVFPDSFIPNQVNVHSIIIKTTLSGDQYYWNNADTIKMCSYQLPATIGYVDHVYYHIDFMGEGSGFANEFVMPEPIIVTGISVNYISNGSNPSYFYVLPADDAGNPDEDNILWSDTVIESNSGSWRDISIPDPIHLRAGEKFFVAHLAGGEDITHGVGTMLPYSYRGWEYIGSYAHSRDRDIFDIAISFTAEADTGRGHIAGIISEVDGTTLLEGAIVSVLQNQTVITSDTTGLDGAYILSNLPVGYFYNVEVSIDNYLGQTIDNVEVVADDTTIVNFQLQPFMAGFDLISPTDSSILTSVKPTVTWHSAIDTHSTLPMYYKIYWDNDENFTSPDSSAQLPDTTYTFIDSLEKSQIYYWRVLAYDNYAVPIYSNQIWSLYINGYPEETIIFSPPNGALADSLTYLVWLKVIDPDSYDTVSYTLEVDDDPLFVSPEINQSGISDSGLIIDEAVAVHLGQLNGFVNLIIDSSYFWRVRCDDIYNASSDWTDGSNYFIYVDSVQNNGPEPFPIYSPSSNLRQVNYYTYFIWGDSYDSYFNFDFTFQYSADSLFSGIVTSISGLTDTSLTIPTDILSLAGQNVFWSIFAINDFDMITFGGIPESECRMLTIIPPGDANGDMLVIGSDVTYLVGYFRGFNQPPDPLFSGDANGDCQLIGSDVIYLLNYFSGRGQPPVRGDCEQPIILIKSGNR